MNAQNGTTRSVAVDIARFVAAAAVVWIHIPTTDQTEDSLALFRFAVPFFTAALVFFTVRTADSANKTPFGAYALQRVQRLYIPFLLWSTFYLAIRAAKLATLHSGSPIVYSPAMLLTGTTHHLWFLPFAAIVSMAAYGAAVLMRPLQSASRHIAAIAAVLFAAMFAFAPIPDATTNGSPVAYFLDHAWRALPSGFLGAAVYWLTRQGRPADSVRWGILAAGILVNIGEFVGFENSLGPHAAGAALLYFTCTQPNSMPALTRWNWAEIAFLVYLIHVLFIEALQTLAARIGGGPSLAGDVSIWALALALSVITAQYTLQFRAFRKRWRLFEPRLAGA